MPPIVMAANVTIATLTTMRDNLVTAFTTISTSPTATYTLGDRTFGYESRHMLMKEIRSLTREILARDTTAKAIGSNRMDFRSWN